VVIDAAAKWEIRDKLDLANVSERLLFPGLDGLCRTLARHYSPKRRTELADKAAIADARRPQKCAFDVGATRAGVPPDRAQRRRSG
jgi:hypothetical protein